MSIALQSAVEQLKLLRNNDISPVELAEEHIRRIERLNPALNAIVDFDPDKVRAQAREVKAGELAAMVAAPVESSNNSPPVPMVRVPPRVRVCAPASLSALTLSAAVVVTLALLR